MHEKDKDRMMPQGDSVCDFLLTDVRLPGDAGHHAPALLPWQHHSRSGLFSSSALDLHACLANHFYHSWFFHSIFNSFLILIIRGQAVLLGSLLVTAVPFNMIIEVAAVSYFHCGVTSWEAISHSQCKLGLCNSFAFLIWGGNYGIRPRSWSGALHNAWRTIYAKGDICLLYKRRQHFLGFFICSHKR